MTRASTSRATRHEPFRFYPGIHQPGDARRTPFVCISINRLWKRRKRVGNRRTRALIDSAGFTEISTHGRWRNGVEVYARRIFELHTQGIVAIEAVVAQDYMCEPFILAKTGLTVAEHQRLTIERYDALVAELMRLFEVSRVEDLPFQVMPVLQGWKPSDYARHVEMYGARLKPGMWVGVGSVCKRNSKVSSVEDVLRAIKEVRPDLRLHGFWPEDHGAQEPQRSPPALDRRLHGLVLRRPSRPEQSDPPACRGPVQGMGADRHHQGSPRDREGARNGAARPQRLARGTALRPGRPQTYQRYRARAAEPAGLRASRVRAA